MPEAISLINMNNRMYDPVVGRMMAVDNFVQDGTYTQAFNRYSYALNNPLSYTDPDGEFLYLVPIVYFLFFTETGYDLQKFVSPVAFKVDLPLGNHQGGIGIRTSIGTPQIEPFGIRINGGIGYYWNNYDITEGWQVTYGFEIRSGGVTFGSMTYNSRGDRFDQRTGTLTIGVPRLNIKYENDHFFGTPLADGGIGTVLLQRSCNWGFSTLA